MKKQYSVIYLYCYTPIKDLEKEREAQHLMCLDCNLLGRVKVAPEGINAKLSGSKEDCGRYIENLLSDPRFAHANIIVDAHSDYVSEKLNVRIKSEIVNAGLPHIKPYEKTGTFITPKEFEKMLEEEELVLIDARSDYETSIGRFKNSIVLPIKNFREFPKHLPQLEKYKDKKVVVNCTTGIKNEKATAYLLSKGFKHVYQIKGGIIGYGKETDGTAFEGVCYVFDNRLTVPVNKKKASIISHCYICKIPSHRVINCANMQCNRHVPICQPCATKNEGACSPSCRTVPQKRAYNGIGYYTKKRNGYNPYKNIKRIHNSLKVSVKSSDLTPSIN